VNDAEVVARFPNAPIDLESLAFFRGLTEQRVLLHRCADCGYRHHPPYPVCPRCWSTEVAASEVSGAGTVILVVTVHHPVPQAGLAGPGPHVLITLDLDEQSGLRFSAPLAVGTDRVPAIGERATITWQHPEDRLLPAVAAQPQDGR
jgi:uncharacterized protein